MNNAAMDPLTAYGEFDRIRDLLGERISDENVRQIGERSDGPVDALERISSIARGLGVDVGATTTKPGTKAEARKSEAPKAPKPTTEKAPAAYQPVKRERREFFQVSNKFFDWQLKMPPVFRLMWADLHRHANGREGRQAKVTTGHVARDCHVHKATVGQAIRFLAYIGAVIVLADPKKVPDGSGRVKWSKGRYYVPPVTTLDPDELRRKIESAPKELLRLRPDERRDRNRLATLKP